MREQTVIHLANVLTIAEADGAATATEEAVLRDVMERLGAGAAEVAAARQLLAQKPPYRLRAFPEPAARMAVIEDMVMMSLADGQISPEESRPLEKFIDSLGYVQADIDMVVRRVRPRLSKISQPTPPPVPPSPPPRTINRFTPRKASPPVASPAPLSAAKTPKPAAVAALPAPPDPVLTDDSALHAEEKKLTPSPPPPWEACAQRRAHAPAEACYCFGAPEGPLNPWGCRLVDMPWAEGAFWLRLGKFRDDATFVFDHDAIAARLRQRLTPVAACPFLMPGIAEAALEALPSRATLGERWQPHTASTAVSDATRVTVRTYMHGCCRQRSVLADSLSPTGDQDARRLIRRAVRQTGAPLNFAMLDKQS